MERKKCAGINTVDLAGNDYLIVIINFITSEKMDLTLYGN